MQFIEPLTQFGLAGLMGVLWVWERMLSRKRDAQLDQAHQRLTEKNTQARLLIRTIQQNTRVIERFEQTQRLVIHLLERMPDAKTTTTRHPQDDPAAGRRVG